MFLRITYLKPSGNKGEFKHPLPKKINPADTASVSSFVNNFVLKLNPQNKPISWHLLDKPQDVYIINSSSFKTLPKDLRQPVIKQYSRKPTLEQVESTTRSFLEKRYLVKYHDSSITDSFRQDTTKWIDEVEMTELKNSTHITNLKILAENKEGKVAEASERVRTSGDIQVAQHQQALKQRYNTAKKQRRQDRTSPGLVLYVETNSQEASESIYKYMKQHSISHLYTGKSPIWFISGIQMEFDIDSCDPNEVSDAKSYLGQFSPTQVKFMEFDRK